MEMKLKTEEQVNTQLWLADGLQYWAVIGAGEEDGEPEAGGDAAAEGDLAAQHLGVQHHHRGSYKQVPNIAAFVLAF